MPKLTKRVVDTASPDPTGRDVFVWDSEVRGYGLKVTAAGGKSYVLQYRTSEGRSRRYSIGKHGSPWTCEEARGKAIELLRGLADGNDPLEAKASAKIVTTVENLADLYLLEGPAAKPNKKQSSWDTDASNLRRHVIPLLGRKSIKALTSADISKFQADVTAGKTAANIKTRLRGRAIVKGGKGVATRSVTVLAAMLQFAVDRELLTKNPAKGVETAKGKKKERFLVDREVIALAEALVAMEEDRTISTTMAATIRLLLLTGCRKSEILTLRWEWVDLDRRCLRLPDSKTGAKVVPLASAVLEILASLERASVWVLPSDKGDGHIVGLQKVWEKVRKRATELARKKAEEGGELPAAAPNLSNVRLHDLRHSFASFAVANGATLFMVSKLLGHKQVRTTEIYAHLADDPLLAAADHTASKIADAMKAGSRSGKGAEVMPLVSKG
jgi:integrase